MYLADVLDLYRTGLVLEKKAGPKIWSVKSKVTLTLSWGLLN